MSVTLKLFVLLAMTFVSGCAWTTSVDTTDASKPAKPTKETVWTVIADYVDAGDITDSTKLELMVKRLRSRGAIDDSQVDKFYSLFDCKTKEIAISKDDSAKLRGI